MFSRLPKRIPTLQVPPQQHITPSPLGGGGSQDTIQVDTLGVLNCPADHVIVHKTGCIQWLLTQPELSQQLLADDEVVRAGQLLCRLQTQLWYIFCPPTPTPQPQGLWCCCISNALILSSLSEAVHPMARPVVVFWNRMPSPTQNIVALQHQALGQALCWSTQAQAGDDRTATPALSHGWFHLLHEMLLCTYMSQSWNSLHAVQRSWKINRRCKPPPDKLQPFACNYVS